MMVIILVLALLFSFYHKMPLLLAVTVPQLPIFLVTRSLLPRPIHAMGLNLCCFLTTSQYFLLFTVARLLLLEYGLLISFIFTTISCVLCCYVFSQLSTDKLFLGKRKDCGKYAATINKVARLLQEQSPILLDYMEFLEDTDERAYNVLESIFINDNTWDETMELADIWERKELDKEIYAIDKALKALFRNE